MLQYKDIKKWKLIYNSDIDIDHLSLFYKILEKSTKNNKTLKDNYNSKILKCDFNNECITIKYPIDRNTRKWIRFTTLFRKGESYKNFMAFYKLKKLKINVPTPILIAELRKFGMVFDSFVVYKYINGNTFSRKNYNHYGEIIKIIKQLHYHNLVHGDAHTENFIYSNKTFAIDVKAKKAYFGKLSKIWDYVQLSYNDIKIENYFPEISSSYLYKFAKKLDKLKDKFNITKKKIKNIIFLKN